MQKNYQYPKNENEFFSRNYSIEQLVSNYTFDELIAYYIYGVKVIRKIDEVINHNLYDELGVTPFKVNCDKTHFIVRTFVVQTALEKMGYCQVAMTSEGVTIINLN